MLMLVNKGLTRHDLLRVQGKGGGIGLALAGRRLRRSFWLILRFDGLGSLDLGFVVPTSGYLKTSSNPVLAFQEVTHEQE